MPGAPTFAGFRDQWLDRAPRPRWPRVRESNPLVPFEYPRLAGESLTVRVTLVLTCQRSGAARGIRTLTVLILSETPPTKLG